MMTTESAMNGNKKWITIERRKEFETANMKTCVFSVTTKDGDVLGMIRWHGAWRQYAFFPDDDTLFEKRCLHDIADFLVECRDMRRDP